LDLAIALAIILVAAAGFWFTTATRLIR
jgi:hypothetical protein